MKNEEADDNNVDVYTLILELRKEQLLVRSERNKIQELNEHIRSKIRNTMEFSWMVTKQRLLLFERDSISRNYSKFDCLAKSNFVDAKEALGCQVRRVLIKQFCFEIIVLKLV